MVGVGLIRATCLKRRRWCGFLMFLLLGEVLATGLFFLTFFSLYSTPRRYAGWVNEEWFEGLAMREGRRIRACL